MYLKCLMYLQRGHLGGVVDLWRLLVVVLRGIVVLWVLELGSPVVVVVVVVAVALLLLRVLLLLLVVVKVPFLVLVVLLHDLERRARQQC